MTTRMAKMIFYVGTLTSGILFLALTFDTHKQISALTNADRLSDEVVAGKRVFEKYNCNDCHTILGFGGYYSPDLTRVYSRRGEEYIRRIVARPEVAFANSFRKMPQQNLTEQEIDYLVEFFRWVNDIDTHDWPPQDSKKRISSATKRLLEGATMSPGAALFKEHNCFDCHQLGGIGGDSGPALDEIGRIRDKETIKRIILNPQEVNPDAQMPAFDLPQDQIEQIADFLSRQGGE